MLTPDTTLILAQSATHASHVLPEGGSVPLGTALMAGLLLWLVGARVIKPVFFLFGLAIGAFVGTTILPLTGLPTFTPGGVTLTPGITGLIAGGILGSLVSLAMFRLVIAITSAMAFAAAGVLGAMIFLHFNPTITDGQLTDTESAMVDSGNALAGITTSLNDTINREAAQHASDLIDQDNKVLDDDTKQQLKDAAARSKEFVEQMYNTIKADLDQRPTRDKLIALSSGFAGLAFGLLVGVVLPKRTTALVTALFGSAVCMASITALLTARSGARPDFLNQSAVTWAIAWVILTAIGLMVQLGFLTRSKNKLQTSNHHDDDDE
jgi:VIT1/CCC1 family predicted Fe2+/Mn2+ transporter